MKSVAIIRSNQRPATVSRQDAFGHAVARRLSDLPGMQAHDIGERLRVARQAAMARHRELALGHRKPLFAAQPALAGAAGGMMGVDPIRWWHRVAAGVPLLVLVAGLIVINVMQADDRASELADVDTALLTDDLPPAAFSDPGFLHFLKTSFADRDK